MRLRNRTAVVTGAASGIGLAIAKSLSRRDCHLALADIDGEKVEDAARSLHAPGCRITCHRLDVADAEQVALFPQTVAAHHPGVDILVNNAGVAVGGTFGQISEEDFEWLFSINFWGVVRMTRAFLPRLRQSSEARIVNISSAFGLISPPSHTAYAASKFAVRGFSNALRYELAGSNVGVTVAHPGGVATSIAENARPPKDATEDEIARMRELAKKALRMPPDRAGEIIVKGIERRAARVLVGADAKLISLVERIAPVSYWTLLRLFLPSA